MNGLRHEDILRHVANQASCSAIVEPVDVEVDPEVVACLTAERPFPAILETLQPAKIAGRFSIFAADPVETIISQSLTEAPIVQLERRIKECCALSPKPCDIPFAGGWIGYISYEAGLPAGLVETRSSASDFPLIRFGLYDHALISDHQIQKWWVTAINWKNCRPSRVSATGRLRALHQRLESARTKQLSVPHAPERKTASTGMTRAQYNSRVLRTKEYIKAGDIYQANLAQRFRVESDGSPFDLYRRVREKNPAAYMAFLSWDDRAIVSASPELFLNLRDGVVITRPIKGTKPRCGIESIDASQCDELDSSQKERSELNMIVDLLRNDLGRVCEFGTVIVKDAGSLEQHPTVFHRVATIEGRLASGKRWYDLLQASFPGGSIVGAPKIRAMQIIRELEPFPRGPYCGAIGWIGLDGNMTFNIAIRTMVWHAGTVDVFAGGGIVAESDADSEYEEILAKAKGLLSGVNASTEGPQLEATTRTLVLHE